MSRVFRILVSLACLALLSGGFGVGVTAPATASATTLCRGYDGCRQLGMPNGGYKAASGTMWWRMYSGHNCTNYAAYRMVRSGLPNDRPWTGAGNATYWGTSNPRLTDSTPRVGAVAWWAANIWPAGSSGHVAYVEKVVSADEIIVSQDSWGGDFSWARITRAGSGWPSGFIHFNDVRLDNTMLPTVSGTPKVDSVLTASHGAWKPAGATYRYRWRADGVAIADATGPTLTLRPAQQGKEVSVRVTASKLGYRSGYAVSASTPAVRPAVLSDKTVPTITGEPVVDSTLTASPGVWTPTPTALTYQWTADDAPIAGATTPTLTLGPELVGRTLSVTVTASRNGYPDDASTSAPTAPVARGTFTADPPTVTGTPRPGETLRLDLGDVAPAGARVSVRWLRAGVPVPGAAGSTYPLTTGDLGARVTARVRLTKAGYTTLTRRAQPTRRVKVLPRLRVRTEPGQRRLHLTVGVTATAVSPVPGTVAVRSRGRLLRTLTLRGGAAAATLRDLPQGLQPFTVRYRGSEKVSASTVNRTVRIG